MDLFLSKPLRDEDVMVLRAHAIAYAAQRGLESSSEAAAKLAAEATAARATTSHDVLGMPLVAAAQRASSRTSSRSSGGSGDGDD